MERETQMGGPNGSFPVTHHSIIVDVRSGDSGVRRAAFDALVATYWKPVYKCLRVKWRVSNDDAKDLTQAFFARALEKGFFDRYDATKARFRTFLRICLDGFVANEQKAAGRLRRGGGVETLPLDFDEAEGELARAEARDGVDVDEYFRQEWMRSLFAIAVETLRGRCGPVAFAIFERYDLDDRNQGITYASLATDLDVPVTQVTNHLAAARRQFRGILLEKLREVCGSDEEFRDEAHQLLGVDVP
ncbi:MAG: sigma-70 family RNA polymerase sigma factor [Planctomycetes bacterium]|nr:sigma-70 family RNA polymerase sigma factor [Planctomycetota bacterium]MBI3844809.1 sigma-70 family RNA polymerase sigma factor [Planctomycetota bacterium]